MYTLEITYQTGNSFGSEITSEELPVVWGNIEKAEQAAHDIIEHNRIYGDCYWCDSRKSGKGEPWYSPDYPEHSILLELDNGERQKTSTFWIGFFERLEDIKITVVSEGRSFGHLIH